MGLVNLICWKHCIYYTPALAHKHTILQLVSEPVLYPSA